jgi:homoserine kinase type II
MAVYTDVSDEALDDFLKDYNLDEVISFKGIAGGVENSNFLLGTERAQYILTLFEKRVNPNDLPFFIGLMDHLAQKGISCPQPVRNKAGEALGQLCDRPTAMVSFLEGMEVRRPQPKHCEALGEAMAKLHLAGADFTIERSNDLTVDRWQGLYEPSQPRADEVEAGLDGLITQALETLQQEWPKDLPRGVIHADLFTDNVFFLRDQLSGIIDFYFACHDYFAYDLAICLNAWCFEQDYSLNVTKAQAMFRGYERVRKLEDRERAALPILARGAALRFLLTRLYDWLNVPQDAIVVPKKPQEYIKKLKFHMTIKTPKAYGLGV